MRDRVDDLATLTRLGGERAALRFERRLDHPPATVWHALTDGGELAHWFPARIDGELVAGGPLTFVFPGGEAPDTTGEVLAIEAPRLLSLGWSGDELRFELSPDGDGCRLVFTHTLSGQALGGGLRAAARTAAGWDTCLWMLAARLDGREDGEDPEPWLARSEAYADRFGLSEGAVQETPEGWTLHFERDLVQPVDEVWALLMTDEEGRAGAPVVGGAPPLRTTSPHVDSGPVISVDAARELVYECRLDGRPVGTVRWELHGEAIGSYVVVEQTVPRDLAQERPVLLAAWQTHLELLVARLHGDARAWPHDRTAALQATYADRVSR